LISHFFFLLYIIAVKSILSQIDDSILIKIPRRLRADHFITPHGSDSCSGSFCGQVFFGERFAFADIAGSNNTFSGKEDVGGRP